MGLLGSLFSAAADIAKETITETMNQNETEKFIKIMMERDAQNAEANEKLYQDWLTHERSNYFAAKKNTIIHDAFDVLMDSFEDTGKFDFSAVDSLSDELKNSDSYKQEAADVVNLCCEALVKLHQKCCISIRFVMQTIHNLQRFADIVPSIRGWIVIMMLSSLLTMPIAVFDRFRQHCGRIRSCQMILIIISRWLEATVRCQGLQL